MRVAVSLAWIAICGCGRVGFEEHTGDGGGSGDQAVSFAYASENVNAVLATTAVDVEPVVTGGPATFSVVPPLPAGLSIDPRDGTISGTPTATADRLAVVVTATTALGSATATLYVTVLPGYVVDTTTDGADDDNGANATCFSTAAGGCSLRAAFQTANSRGVKQLVILGPKSYSISGGAFPAIANDIAIAGSGPAATTIAAATLHPGYSFATLNTAHSLALIGLQIDGFGSVDGGAVHQQAGQLYVDECDFTRNDSAGSGGVLFINGGATATFENSTFENNTSFGGCCSGWGGVIDGENANTTIFVRRSTATGNSTAWGAFAHLTTGCTLTLENSTLYGNKSTVSGTLASPGGHYVLVNDTIAYNTNTYATPNDGNQTSGGIYMYSNPAAYQLTNVLLVHNTLFDGSERECSHRVAGGSTTLVSNGGNALGDNGGLNCMPDFIATDRLSTDPGLDAAMPAAHGGPTPTMLLLPGAVAIDGAVNAGCPATDQRGVRRPVGPSCDIGAVEMP